MYIKYLTLVVVLFITSCANIKPPTGGEKDLDPPEMIRTDPPQNSINFSSDEITLYFNEQVETKGLNNELIITPDDNIQFKEIPRKKSITIRFKDTLRSNTTYNLNFGNSVVDITERNPSLNAKLAFSTGPDIDTAFIKGNAIDMFYQEPLEKVIAILHPLTDSLDPQRQKPSYLARADEEGNFQLSNLPVDTFVLYAIQDLNGNLTYNSNEEKIARYPDLIIPSYTDTSYQLFLSPQDTRPLSLLSVRHHFNYSSFIFNKGIYEYQIENDTFLSYTSDKNKHINIYHPFSINDSISINLNISDSSNYNLDTLLFIKKDFESDTLDPELSISIYPETGDLIKIPDTVEVSFNQDLEKIFLDSILYVRNGSDTLIEVLDNFIIKNTKTIKFENRFNKRLQRIKMVFIHPLITSEYNDTLKSLSIEYSIPPEEKFGQIEGEIQSVYENLILQLINSKGKKVLEQILSPGPFTFYHIEPGTYKLRLIHDENNNGKWDAGDHFKNIQPEKVLIYDEDILIKANWIVQDKILELY